MTLFAQFSANTRIFLPEVRHVPRHADPGRLRRLQRDVPA